MTEIITGELFKTMVINAAAAIENNKNDINELNVFPVPDGDTGTNMSLTIGSGATSLKNASPDTIGRAADITASALLRGARGNSGVILSLLFRGIAKHLKERTTADAKCFAAAIQAGVEAAYNAVMKPAEGTILTVSRLAAAEAVAAARDEKDIEVVLARAIEAAKAALANTINQNPVLKKAGVIDAGGKGYVLALDGMLRALKGELIEVVSDNEAAVNDKADFAGFESESITFAYDTVYIVRKLKPEKPLEPLRAYLDSIGDSLVISEDDEVFKVHVHTNIPGEALTDSQKYGTLETAEIENMRTQHDALVEQKAAEAEAAAGPAAPEKKYGVVTVCAGDGMADIFHDLGVDGIITGGQTMNPSTEDILEKINRTPSEIVFVLPNNKNIIMAAEQCVPLSDKKVIVIPTKTVPQGISAMLALDTTASCEDNAEVMREAASRVHTVQITYAARDSVFGEQEIKAGEYLALLEDSLICNSSKLDDIIESVVGRLRDCAPEFITIYSGEDVSEEDAGAFAERIGAGIPSADTAAVSGGQPVYYYVISAE